MDLSQTQLWSLSPDNHKLLVGKEHWMDEHDKLHTRILCSQGRNCWTQYPTRWSVMLRLMLYTHGQVQEKHILYYEPEHFLE